MGLNLSEDEIKLVRSFLDGAEPYTEEDDEYWMLDGPADFKRTLATMIADLEKDEAEEI